MEGSVPRPMAESSTSTSKGASGPELRARLTRFYERYNRDHLSKIDFILELYENDPISLFRDLEARYGPEPTVQQEEAGTAHPTQSLVSKDAFQHNRTDTLNMSMTLMSPVDASSPYHGKRGGAFENSFAATPLVQPASVAAVRDGAFSPNRRHTSNHLGGLFSHKSESRDPSIAAGNAVVAPPRVTAADTNSDTLITNTTSVVYRHDTKSVVEATARRIVDSAKMQAPLGHLASTTALVMQRAAAADMYAQHLETLRSGAAGPQQQHSGSPRRYHTPAPAPIVPPVRALQSTLNIDDMSSYQTLMRAQRQTLRDMSHADAVPQRHPLSAQHASPRAGGLFVMSSEARPLIGQPVTYEGAVSKGIATDRARTRLRELQTSPLVALARTRQLATEKSQKGYALQPFHLVGAPSPESHMGETPHDSPQSEQQGVEMICTECGMICRIIPGHENEFAHTH